MAPERRFINSGSGDSIGVQGANGSGKSLLLWLMTEHLTPEQECVLVDGQDLSQVRSDELWQATGLLSDQGEIIGKEHFLKT